MGKKQISGIRSLGLELLGMYFIDVGIFLDQSLLRA